MTRDEAITALVGKALSLAAQATNGWAGYARTKLEHDDITRLHAERQELADTLSALGPRFSDAHTWEIERLLERLKSEEVGRQNFPLIQALDAALSALGGRPETGWQPIATAPKDGKRIICWGPELAVAECEYRLAWHSDVGGWYRSNQHPVVNPTHWQPLPSPPLQEQP